MTRSIFLSLVFHSFMIVITAISLPFMKRTPIDLPPIRAYTVTGGVTFSFGGVSINTSCEVLDVADQPILGLYASGDVVGLFFHNYPSCTGQTRNAVFSLEAGKNAAQRANQ